MSDGVNISVNDVSEPTAVHVHQLEVCAADCKKAYAPGKNLMHCTVCSAHYIREDFEQLKRLTHTDAD